MSATATALPPPDLPGLTRKVVARYRDASKFSRHFVRGKLLTDPATPFVLRLAAASGGFGEVTDLGCGRGQIGLSLLTAGLATRVQGLDLDPGKVADAARAAAGLPAGFAVADLCQAAVPAADTVVIFDVLLQLPVAAQRSLLARMAAAARRRIVIRAFDPERGWRSGVGVVMERLGCLVRRDGSSFAPLPLAELAGPLRVAGFAVTVSPCWGWTPLPNVMLVAERAP
ncbi:class I SAM-dependent methyltransferase [Siccirubricoccus sp. KC 17139]|uniref:Class I SAM-dependent methyltransferase n=1 Tax=Siccirubricoccus soli TaxID=2899147 RepID=A0ABT1D7S7_9PROT|nr:class I SAM-dependent methyltransferase [Siccirubricoccus soli]MCO6417996.1 class I SAM-dependent methyltransferase [Siccirubricoccus soli]MCP2684131.1 class I SAM-dependent methyltransferase [Siccirubricoccus soli]